MTLNALLLDLDGTLVDSAPDLIASLDELRTSLGLGACNAEQVREQVAHGGLGMLHAGFTADEHNRPESLLDTFLDHYESRLYRSSSLFSGMADLLQKLDSEGIPWGVVTNKSERFAIPLLAQAELLQRASCVVCGDTLPQSKPAPEPLLLACELLGLAPNTVAMLGDDNKDLESAGAAGCYGIWAAWGYGGPQPPDSWSTAPILNHPGDLILESSGPGIKLPPRSDLTT